MRMAVSTNNSLLPWLIYPAVIFGCLFLHMVMLQSGITLQAATLIPVLVGAALVTVFEQILPYDASWRAKWEDVRQDALFMLMIQQALPKLLALSVMIAITGTASGVIPPSEYWPHQSPVLLQAVLMMLIADFLRYWLHRFAHENALLWRFHAVHHSPQKLYWLNVGRFHPVDKALQFLLDALPFILLGVNDAVIAMYFVFYAVNGFFQHSNVQVRFGILNYILSSAELHRWHHSQVSEESNNNYGNNLIIWDLLFGTRLLPVDRHIHELGLKNKHYPMNFPAQMITPFTSGIAERDVSLHGFINNIINLFIRVRMWHIQWRYWRPLFHATREPRQAQMNVLQDILTCNQATRYGREHDFSSIHDYETYRQHVPVNDYDALWPYIEAHQQGDERALLQDDIIMYAVTSGTTSAPKLLPISERMLRDYKRNQAIFSCLQYRHNPAAFAGRYLGIVSGAVEGYTDEGIPYGSISGVLNQKMPRIAQQKYITPPGIYELRDYDLKYYLILRLALMHRSLSYIVCANPSTLLKLESLINAELDKYIDEIAAGTLRDMLGMQSLPEDLREAIVSHVHPRPERAARLSKLCGKLPYVKLRDVWPELKMITTWKGGSCSIAFETLQKSLSSETEVIDLGYLSSEFRGSFTYDYATGAGIPSLQDNFFEFVNVKEHSKEAVEFLTLDQLQVGDDYSIYVTTRGGLYRYHMNDLVRVEGFLNRTPLIRFLQKGKGVTSITGEKLYENQVIKAVREALDAAGIYATFYLMLADRQRSVYTLCIEVSQSDINDSDDLAVDIDCRLGNINLEYKAKRDSGRIAPLEVYLLPPGAGERYRLACLQNGQKEGQFKIIALQYSDETMLDLAERNT